MENDTAPHANAESALPANPAELQAKYSQQPISAQQTSPQMSAPETSVAAQFQEGAPNFQQTVPPVQNIYITQQVQQATPGVMIVGSQKNVFVAFLLTFFFGPLGMFYSTVMGAIIMLVISIVVGAVTLGVGLVITWPITIIWGCIAASNYNARLTSQSMTQISR